MDKKQHIVRSEFLESGLQRICVYAANIDTAVFEFTHDADGGDSVYDFDINFHNQCRTVTADLHFLPHSEYDDAGLCGADRPFAA